MLIIRNKVTGKLNNMGTNSAFPDGEIPNIVLKKNEEAIKIHDDDELARKILTAHEYEFNEDLTDITITKTREQWRAEQPAPEVKLTELQLLKAELDELKSKLQKVETDVSAIKPK